ncbi:MAG: hypothetical protein AAGI52_02595 [Bacteroidota bacterium]
MSTATAESSFSSSAWKYAGGLLVGVPLLLNQFGSALNTFDLVSWRIYHAWVRPFVNLNDPIAWVTFGHVIALSSAVALVVTVRLLRTANQEAFILGTRDGLLSAPAAAFTLVLCVLVWVILKLVFVVLAFIFGIIAKVVSWLAIPFIWLFNTLVAPVLEFLSPPFVWVYEQILLPIAEFISPPFAWLLNVILKPVFGFIVKWIIVPLLILVVFVTAMTPFAVVGRAYLTDLRSAFRGAPGLAEAYGQGFMLGVLTSFALLTIGLEWLGYLSDQPSAAVLVGLGISVLYALQCKSLAPRAEKSADVPAIEDIGVIRKAWFERSGLATVVGVGLSSLLIVMVMFSGGAVGGD